MSNNKENGLEVELARIRIHTTVENILITQHAHQEMVEENITFEQVLEAITSGKILENYPLHRRGACCLLHGITKMVALCTLFVRPKHLY
jgi:hypothetical protein